MLHSLCTKGASRAALNSLQSAMSGHRCALVSAILTRQRTFASIVQFQAFACLCNSHMMSNPAVFCVGTDAVPRNVRCGARRKKKPYYYYY